MHALDLGQPAEVADRERPRRIGGRQANAQYQYTLQADDLEDLRTWDPRIRRAMMALPELVDVNTDQQDRGLQTSLVIDRDAVLAEDLSPMDAYRLDQCNCDDCVKLFGGKAMDFNDHKARGASGKLWQAYLRITERARAKHPAVRFEVLNYQDTPVTADIIKRFPDNLIVLVQFASQHDFDKLAGVEFPAGISGFEVDGEGKGKLAWQLGAGVAFNVSPGIALTADYRHRQVGATEVPYDNASGFRVTSLKTDSLQAGFRVKF